MRRLVDCGLLLAVVILFNGCAPEQVRPNYPTPSAPPNAISVQQLAQRLGLAIDGDTPSRVTLSNAANHVVLLPNPIGQVFVNGVRVGAQGGLVRSGGALFVPESLENDIRSALKPLPGPENPARAPKPPHAAPRPPLARAYRIVIDPGHGGKDSGTISRGGVMEKTITLPVAKELARLLKQEGFNVVMTRHSDTFIELDERAEIANRFNADLFISIHADACADPLMRGFTVYTCRGPSQASRGVAESVAESLRKTEREGLGLRQANYRVLVVTRCPAILVELGYLSNSQDAEMLTAPAVRLRLARAIADGIAQYFGR